MGYYSTFNVKLPKKMLESGDKVKELRSAIQKLEAVGVATNELYGQLNKLSTDPYPKTYEFHSVSSGDPRKLYHCDTAVDYITYSTEDSVKWYEFETDMCEFSKKFPTYVIEAARSGEDSGDFKLYRFKNGKCQTVKAEIRFPTDKFRDEFQDACMTCDFHSQDVDVR